MKVIKELNKNRKDNFFWKTKIIIVYEVILS